MNVFTISDLADEFDISTRTIRYYEEVGLIQPLERQVGKQRLYDRKARARLKLILRGKKFGFSLNEIKEMIELYEVDPTEKEQLKKTIEYGDQKLEEIEEKIEELTLLKEEILNLRSKFVEKLKELDR
ncbi:MerR family transcriptional regulator [Natranaerofaba carboxydovora]|uniref:MerR family transcriptional regulator n=1 Tax=Natranaerofaba carboxydovora TaxID=2742683 RepID=UPI001F12AA7D|nr:MerR family DNA-binding transcriptional regulator [Natranaerofaba carboxydovora]UMZ74458.1 Mercuric resistance operon regulatory protein [Natranaerofaba carboxydovora]